MVRAFSLPADGTTRHKHPLLPGSTHPVPLCHFSRDHLPAIRKRPDAYAPGATRIRAPGHARHYVPATRTAPGRNRYSYNAVHGDAYRRDAPAWHTAGNGAC